MCDACFVGERIMKTLSVLAIRLYLKHSGDPTVGCTARNCHGGTCNPTTNLCTCPACKTVVSDCLNRKRG